VWVWVLCRDRAGGGLWGFCLLGQVVDMGGFVDSDKGMDRGVLPHSGRWGICDRSMKELSQTEWLLLLLLFWAPRPGDWMCVVGPLRLAELCPD